MEEIDKCDSHPNQQIHLICTEVGCNFQRLCAMCVPNHSKHRIVNIDQYWKGKFQDLDFSDLEKEMKRDMKEPFGMKESSVLFACQDMKKFIFDWGRKLEIYITKSISKDVKSMIKMINNYEEYLLNNIQENNVDLNQILKNKEENKKNKKKMMKALNRSKFSLIETYFKDLTKIQEGTKNIMEKMKEKQKNKKSEILMKEMKSKTEKGVKELFEHINQVIKDVDLKELEGKFKKVEEKKEKTPKRVKQHIFQGIISASRDKSLILWDKNYKQKSTHKGKSGYFKLIELSSGGIAATTGDPDNSVEILDLNLSVLSTIRGHTDSLLDICNMGESDVITGSYDQTVRMWDVRSGECTQILKGHTAGVTCVHLHRKLGYLLTGSYYGFVRIWDVTTTPQTYKLIAQTSHQGACVMDFVELDAGRMLSICCGGSSLGVKVWELREEGTVNTIKDIPPPEQERVGFRCGLGISGTKGVLLGGGEGNLMLFDVHTYALTPLIHNLHKRGIMQIKELKANIYVTCSVDKSIKIMNVATKKVLQTLLGHTHWVSSILPIFAEE